MQQITNTLGNTVCIVIVGVFFVPFMVAMANAQICPPNLISYWKLDDAMGVVATDSVGPNDGTLVNGPVWTAGQVNGALDFIGNNESYILVPASPSLKPTSAITLEAWIKPSTVSPDQHIFSTAADTPILGHNYYLNFAPLYCFPTLC